MRKDEAAQIGAVLARKKAANKKKHNQSRWYNKELKSLLGNQWAIFYGILGGRMTGKSYALTDYLCNQKKKKGKLVKNYWMRISETSTQAMLANKAQKLVDPDLVRKYKLDLTVKGRDVYNNNEPFMTVLPLSAMAKLKGVAFFDKDYKGEYNIVLDEFQLEQGERRTTFDIAYNFIGMIENIARNTKTRLRIFLVGNTLEEASTILKAFNFLPEGFGRFYLKRKRCVIDNIEPTEEYLRDREGSAADLLGGKEMSNYTNEIKKDISLIYKGRLNRPAYVIKFGKDRDKHYIVWDAGIDGNVITRSKGQAVKNTIAMRPYIDERYNVERRQLVFDLFDAKQYKFDTLITLSYFQSELQKIRK
jgi:hypothetical protein